MITPAAIFLFLVVILLFVSVLLGWYFYLKIRNKERMALIEKDKDVSEFYTRRKTSFSFHFPWLKVGIITTGFSIGFVVVEILMQVFFINEEGRYLKGSDSIGIGILFLFTSVSILIAYFADKPKNRE